MACELTTGFALDCKDGVGGIKELFFAKHAEAYTNVTIAAGIVTALGTMTVFRYQLPPNTGSFDQVPSIDETNGTVFWTQTITAILHKMSTAKNIELNLLAKQRLVAFVLDQNDNLFIVGRQDGVNLSGGNYGTGTAKGDLNGANLTFTAMEKLPAEMLTAFTLTPFDNFELVTVNPAYPVPET